MLNFKKNLLKETVLYLFFGIMTTVINTVTYSVAFGYLKWENLLANLVAWILAVAFAFITNKYWVFESKSFQKEVVISELAAFLSCRIATGLLDMIIMFMSVDVCKANAYVMKIISNIIVIVLNYVASKLIIF